MANVTGNPKRTIGTILTMGFSCVLFVIISNYVGNIDTEHEARLYVNHIKEHHGAAVSILNIVQTKGKYGVDIGEAFYLL